MKRLDMTNGDVTDHIPDDRTPVIRVECATCGGYNEWEESGHENKPVRCLGCGTLHIRRRLVDINSSDNYAAPNND